MSYKLSEVEAFRAQVLLEEALKKLGFLTHITSSASGGDELTQFMGDEISRIIQEQRDLEKKYEELIAKRGQSKGLCNKATFLETQQEIQDVATRLKESNKSLCRNLKENPNVQGNLQKMQLERQQVQDWLTETRGDLMEMSFQNLVQKVDLERRDQERLNEVKKKEKEASQTVRQLEAELLREQADHDKETKLAQNEIRELKDDLQKNRTISDIEYKFEEKKLRAQEQALIRVHAQMQKKLEEELTELQNAQDLEQTVHDNADVFLEEKKNKLEEMREQWKKTSQSEDEDRKSDLQSIETKRATNYKELVELQDRRDTERLAHQQKEVEMRNAVLIEKQQREQLARMADAVLFLQDEGRKYMERLALRRAAAKGKKGKKGKKK
jgi:DNA repair exonuclease SbcCD ATPase subunit